MQAMALPVVLTTSGHVVVGAKTGAGKTLVGVAAALRAIRLEGRKAVWLTPARSLAGELDAKFQQWHAHGVRVVKLTGEEQTPTPELRRAHLWVATTEKFESVCRKTSARALIDDVGCIVVDEIHLVGDATRGPTLEGLLARLRLVAQQTRIVGLSGTVSTPARRSVNRLLASHVLDLLALRRLVRDGQWQGCYSLDIKLLGL